MIIAGLFAVIVILLFLPLDQRIGAVEAEIEKSKAIKATTEADRTEFSTEEVKGSPVGKMQEKAEAAKGDLVGKAQESTEAVKEHPVEKTQESAEATKVSLRKEDKKALK